MAERDSLFVTGVDQEEGRVGLGAMWTPATNAVKAKTGLRPSSGNPGVVTATGTPDGFVHVAPFQAILQDVRGTTGGVYIMTLDATKDINILSTPAHASLARNDLIIAHQSDVFYSDADNQMRVRQVVGTPAGSPADPSLASYPNSITLARVRVDANATSIASGKITDLRPAYTVALGGLLPVASQTLRNALTGLYEGFQILRTDRDWIEVYDGSGWRVQGVAVVSSTGDLSAITSPYSGQVAYNTGDGMMYRYTGSAWRVRGTWSSTQTLSVAGGSAASPIVFTIPAYLRRLNVMWTGRTDAAISTTAVQMRVNADSGANYAWNGTQGTTPFSGSGQTSMTIGHVYGTSGVANVFTTGDVDLPGWDAPHSRLSALFRYGAQDPSGGGFYGIATGLYSNNGPFTELRFWAASGNLIAGSQFILTGIE